VRKQTRAIDGFLCGVETEGMNVEVIRQRVHGAAFRPFAVVTSSGHKHPVQHTDFIFLTQRTVIVADAKGYTTGLDPLHIVGLEDIPPGKNTRQRGRRRAKKTGNFLVFPAANQGGCFSLERRFVRS
jgi:hypothetical protein